MFLKRKIFFFFSKFIITKLIILILQSNPTKDNTEWEQWRIGSFDAFRSRKYAELNWWIGIKKNGRPKLGPATSWGQKAIQFSPLIKGILKNI